MGAYLTFCADVLTEAVTDGRIEPADYCFPILAKGFRRLKAKTLASLLRTESDARLAMGIVERVERMEAEKVSAVAA